MRGLVQNKNALRVNFEVIIEFLDGCVGERAKELGDP
jgi:hypothetical protein